ncbi:sodium/glutamate symporter [Fontivita pretiosa]|uniref:sodium/glutamate symporter n=1 Tax=Fontivita pretiosa TaxID=2989684 RepID=UPI003D173805
MTALAALSVQHPFVLTLLFACGLLAAGLALRTAVGFLRRLFIPAAVVGGVIGFAIVQLGSRASSPQLRLFSRTIDSQLSDWPGLLIAVVFAGLLLEKTSSKSFAEALRRGARSAILAWIIILGQIVIGLLVYLVMVRPKNPGIPASFGQLLEVSWAGGHGASAAMGEVYRSLGFEQGRDLAFFLATVGLIWGVASGLVLVNLAIRRGWTHAAGQLARIEAISGLEPRSQPQQQPIGYARTRGEVLDPLAMQLVILAAAFAAGYIIRETFITLANWIAPDRPEASIPISNIPVFLFTLLGGWAVRELMRLFRIADLIDPGSIQRLLGVAMELLIVSAVTTMRLEALQTYFAPVLALLILAAAWSAICLLVLAPRLLPRAYWFELGLLNYGFSTANTPQGMMLLRIVDPDLKSGAAEDYAVAAPLSAPFVGGGIVTIVLMPALLQRVSSAWVILALLAVIASLYGIGRRLSH